MSKRKNFEKLDDTLKQVDLDEYEKKLSNLQEYVKRLKKIKKKQKKLKKLKKEKKEVMRKINKKDI